MSIHKRTGRPNKPWEVRWKEGRRQRSRSFPRKRDAAAFQRDLDARRAMGAHAPVEPSRESLDAWFDRWQELRRNDLAPSTFSQMVARYEKWIGPFIGSRRLADLGRAAVYDWRHEILEAGASESVANAALRELSAILGRAVDHGWLPSNPCRGVKRLRVQPKTREALEPVDIECLRLALLPRDATMVSVMAYGGLRPGEVVALRPEDIGERSIIVERAWTAGEIRPTKTYERRAVQMCDTLADDLEQWVAQRPESEWLFPNRDGNPWNEANWRRRQFAPACAELGIDAVPYQLRHTYASLMIFEGVPLMNVAAALGHRTAETTLRHYAHAMEEARAHPRAQPMDDVIQAARAEAAKPTD